MAQPFEAHPHFVHLTPERGQPPAGSEARIGAIALHQEATPQFEPAAYDHLDRGFQPVPSHKSPVAPPVRYTPRR